MTANKNISETTSEMISETHPAPAIRVTNLTVAYGDTPVLWDIHLSIPCGVLMGVVGPNGAGKTTLIKSLLGLVKPLCGQVHFLNQPYQRQRQQVAYIPQKGSIDWDFPTTVLDVVMMGTYGKLGWFKRPDSKAKKQAMDALAAVDMTGLSMRPIGQLSGGQQQRVLLARAIVQDAQIYLLDEPFQGVDAVTEKTMMANLQQWTDAGKTVIVVHHDLQTVPHYFNWVTLLNVQCIACGPVDAVFTDENIHQTYASPHVTARGFSAVFASTGAQCDNV
nr:metal ABC transporter ATP-binding protein [Ostreibacterium oceani]